MGPRFQRFALVTVLALHVLLLAGYTFPQRWTGERLRILGQWYARPVLHQRWDLFAPDPPQCSCALEVRTAEGEWRAVDAVARHYLERRMVHNHCLYLTAGLPLDGARTYRALLRMSHLDPAQLPEFRIVEHCVEDPVRPTERITRITPLQLP